MIFTAVLYLHTLPFFSRNTIKLESAFLQKLDNIIYFSNLYTYTWSVPIFTGFYSCLNKNGERVRVKNKLNIKLCWFIFD